MAYCVDGAPFGNRSFPPDTWLKAKEAITEEVLHEFRAGCESAVPEVKVTTAAVDTGPAAALTEISVMARFSRSGLPLERSPERPRLACPRMPPARSWSSGAG